MLIQSIYLCLENHIPALHVVATNCGIVTVSSKPSSIFLLGQLFQDGGELGKNSGFHGHGPTLTPLLIK